jgi:hypothetical protein
MAEILRIARSAGRYTVLNEDGTVLISHSGKAAAIAAAIAHLHEGVGGEVIMLSESGGISSRIPVVGSQESTMPDPAAKTPSPGQNTDTRRPRAPEAAPAPEQHADPHRSAPRSPEPSTKPASAFIDPPTKGGPEDIADAAGEAAKAVDKAFGLKDPDSVLPKDISDIKMASVLPKSAAKNPTVTLLNVHMSVAAAWTAWVLLLFGTGTLSAVVQAGKRAAAGGTTVGDYASTVAVFFAASALCISVAAATWAVFAGKTRRSFALGGWVIGTVIVSGLLSWAGFAAPTWEAIATAVDKGNGTPPGVIASVLGAFFVYYGPLTFFSGLGVGVVLGHLAYKISER